MKKILMLKPKNLLTHPKNMRRFYPVKQVREMANSILAIRGVLQPLIIVKEPVKNSHKYYVVDGNMRLAAARLLEDQCPPLKCDIVEQKEAEQQLSMIVANQVRYDVDPVSEGLHYKALQKEGMTVRKISKLTGVYEARITNRKILADLPISIQQLIVEDRLPASPLTAKALLELPEKTAVRLAERLAKNPNIKIRTILAAAERLMEGKVNTKNLKRPAVELSGAGISEKKKTNLKEIRAAAKNACQKCNQYEGKLCQTPEPAWAAVVHAADDTCTKCPLKEMSDICKSCPAVQLLKKLVNDEKS